MAFVTIPTTGAGQAAAIEAALQAQGPEDVLVTPDQDYFLERALNVQAPKGRWWGGGENFTRFICASNPPAATLPLPALDNLVIAFGGRTEAQNVHPPGAPPALNFWQALDGSDVIDFEMRDMSFESRGVGNVGVMNFGPYTNYAQRHMIAVGPNGTFDRTVAGEFAAVHRCNFRAKRIRLDGAQVGGLPNTVFGCLVGGVEFVPAAVAAEENLYLPDNASSVPSFGFGDNLTGPVAGIMTLNFAAGAFAGADIGRIVRVLRATNVVNNGSFAITGTTPTSISFANAGIAEVSAGLLWDIDSYGGYTDDARTVMNGNVSFEDCTFRNFSAAGVDVQGFYGVPAAPGPYTFPAASVLRPQIVFDGNMISACGIGSDSGQIASLLFNNNGGADIHVRNNFFLQSAALSFLVDFFSFTAADYSAVPAGTQNLLHTPSGLIRISNNMFQSGPALLGRFDLDQVFVDDGFISENFGGQVGPDRQRVILEGNEFDTRAPAGYAGDYWFLRRANAGTQRGIESRNNRYAGTRFFTGAVTPGEGVRVFGNETTL